MLFNSLTFVVFYVVVTTLYWGLSGWNLRKNLLVVASYIFYGAWNPPFAALLFSTTAMDFWVGRQIAKAKDGHSKRGWLVASVCMNLSMLGFFKYGNFLLLNFQWLLARLGIIYQPPHLDILLPVGISFYTFHSLSYTLDIYRGVLRPTKSLRDFILAVSFFPQLVAGPIVRAGVPHLFFAPPGSPPKDRAEKGIKRFHNQTPAQRVSEYLAMPLEEHVAFLKPDDLSLEALLNQLPIPNRPSALVPPRFPPYFQAEDRERRARMWEKCAEPGSELAKQIQQIWIPLFTPPAPPTYIPKDVFFAQVNEGIQKRFADVTAAVGKIRSRGGKIVFVRFPHTGGLKELEDRITPREKTWDPLLKMTGAPGIYYSDFPDLSGFNCPEWSHLSAGDSVEFSKRLVPHLRAALKM